jgi:hypothetical protein
MRVDKLSEHDILSQPIPPLAPKAPGRRWSPGRVRLAGYVVGVGLVVGLAALGFWLTTVVRGNPAAAAATSAPEAATAVASLALDRPIVTEEGLVEKSGVRIVYVAVTGGGGLIDLRYQVVDPDKANAVHDANNPPTLVDEATGLVVNQLLMGHLHTRTFTAGQTYYLIFENPGNIVQSGNKVSVLLGDAEVDHVTVK